MDYGEALQLIDEALSGPAAGGSARALFGATQRVNAWVGVAVGPGDRPGDYGLLVLLERRDAEGTDAVEQLRSELGAPVSALVIGSPEPELALVLPGDGIVPASRPEQSGTLGAWVRTVEGQIALLTNEHVVSSGAGSPLGELVFARADEQDSPPLARVSRTGRLADSSAGGLDAALAELLDESRLGFEPSALTGSAPTPLSGDRVVKRGAASGLTVGEVRGSGGRVHVRYASGSHELRDVVVTTGLAGAAFTRPGDSGSLICDSSGTRAVALHVAGTRQSAYGVPASLSQQIDAVLAELGASLLL